MNHRNHGVSGCLGQSDAQQKAYCKRGLGLCQLVTQLRPVGSCVSHCRMYFIEWSIEDTLQSWRCSSWSLAPQRSRAV